MKFCPDGRRASRHFSILWGSVVFGLFSLLPAVAETASPLTAGALTAEQVVNRMVEKNQERAAALEAYQGNRLYTLSYVGFPATLHADMTVSMTYKAPADKEFTVVSESGNKWIINHVFQRLIQSEKEALDNENRASTALNTNNYDFKLLSDEPTADGCSYVLEVEPKVVNKFHYRGRIWVDSKDFAVCRIEAEPAKNPSFWIRKTEIHHVYEKVGDFWLPADNKSVSNVRLGGTATLTIKYEDYKILPAHALNQTGGEPLSASPIAAK